MQSAGKLNGTLDPWSDSESDDKSFTAKSPAEDETEEQKKMAEQEGKVQDKVFVRPYEEKDREAVADVVSTILFFHRRISSVVAQTFPSSK